jgi:hypothetical protein
MKFLPKGCSQVALPTAQGFMWRADSWCYFIDFSVEGDDVERNLF